MGIVLTADQRDALRDQILVGLSGIDDLWLVAQSGDFETARRLAEQISDDLRLLNVDLGWEEQADREEFELTLPPDVLRRAFGRHCQIALMRDASEVAERAELRENKEINAFVVETCQGVLAKVSAGSRGGFGQSSRRPGLP